MSFAQTSLILLIGLCTFGCAGLRPPHPPLATLAAGSERFRPGQIVDVAAGKAIAFDELIGRIACKDLIFVGEVHHNPDHHLIQIQILQALAKHSPPLSVAMEVFQKQHQPEVDRYLRGESTEGELLGAADWKKTWGFDYHLYRPLLLLAREKGWRVLAINAPSAVVDKVAKTGLRSLESREREQIPREIDLGRDRHRAFVSAIYKAHSPHRRRVFDFFYEAQCVREETMAQTLAEHLRTVPGKVIAFTGNGHLVYSFGIPDRTARRAPVSIVTVMPYPLNGKENIERGIADYLWFTRSSPRRLSVAQGGL